MAIKELKAIQQYFDGGSFLQLAKALDMSPNGAGKKALKVVKERLKELDVKIYG